MNSQQLKIYCDYWKIEFPFFELIEDETQLYLCKVNIYNTLLFTTDYHSNENEALIGGIKKFMDYCNNEKNFINLVELSRNNDFYHKK